MDPTSKIFLSSSPTTSASIHDFIQTEKFHFPVQDLLRQECVQTEIPSFSFTGSDSVNVHFRVSSLMPGTIQVSVMDFQGPPSTSTPAAFLKVSLGKREYQTSGKGDFSFPLTNIRENLVVKLVDSEGNETARTGIQTMSIVQKVSWDEIFSFNGGGGYVHLKLQFILSEEERARIRLKREAAVKKKQQGKIPKGSETLDIAGSVTSSRQAEREETDLRTRTVLAVGSLDNVAKQASLLQNTDISNADPRSSYGTEGSNLKQRSPKPTNEREGALSAPTVRGNEKDSVEANQNVKNPEIESSLPNVQPVQVKEDSSRLLYSRSYAAEKNSVVFLVKDDDHVDKSEKQVPLARSLSSVRNLVTAFESGIPKDTKSSVKIPIIRSESKKVGKQGHPKDYFPVDFSESAKQSSGRHKDPLVEGNLRPTLETSTGKGEGTDSAKNSVMLNETMKKMEKLIAAPIRSMENKSNSRALAESTAYWESSSTAEKPTVSGRMHTEQSGGDSFRLSAEKQYSGGTLLAEGRGRTDSTKIDIQVASFEKSKSLECYKEELLYYENSGMWIFPNNTKHLCVTAAGQRVKDLLGSGIPETKSHQKNSFLSSGEGRKESMHDASEYEMQKDQEGSQSLNSSSSENSPGKGSGGLFGQVLKIAIIVGFGVLVLVTRQREPRKSKREADELSLATSEFMDEQSAAEE